MLKTKPISTWVYRLLILLTVGVATFSANALISMAAILPINGSSSPINCQLKHSTNGTTVLKFPSSGIAQNVLTDLGGSASGSSTKFSLDCPTSYNGSITGNSTNGWFVFPSFHSTCSTPDTWTPSGTGNSKYYTLQVNGTNCDTVIWDFSTILHPEQSCHFGYNDNSGTISGTNGQDYDLQFNHWDGTKGASYEKASQWLTTSIIEAVHIIGAWADIEDIQVVFDSSEDHTTNPTNVQGQTIDLSPIKVYPGCTG
jgi:hypothetical protein